MTALLVETEDFVLAATWTHDHVGDALCSAQARLAADLDGGHAMAGSDPGGQAWAAAYDRAGASAMRAQTDLTNGVYNLARMFAQTALNYEAADGASTPSVRAAVADQIGMLPPSSWLGPPSAIPTALGGSGGPPHGWGLIEHLVGYVWPNGHQDRLHAAANAWHRSAVALRSIADDVTFPTIVFVDNRLPELDDIRTVLVAMRRRTAVLADVHDALAQGCTDLARHIDEAHSSVEHELVSLIEWTAGIEVGGGLLSIFTFGGSEAVAQGMEAGRIARTAAAVGAIIERFIAASRTVAATVAALTERADLIAAELAGLQDVRLSYAVVQTVRALPPVIAIREVTALNRLSAEARGLPRLLATDGQLGHKFKHAKDFGVLLPPGKQGFAAFRDAMQRFLEEPGTIRLDATKARFHRQPAILSYNPRSMLVVIQRADGTFWSSWRMSDVQLWTLRVYGSLGRG